MALIVTRIVTLLVLAMFVAIAARRLRLPYTVGLVLTGLALALSHLQLGIELTHEIVFDLILPPLLFEAALNLSWDEVRRDSVLLLALSTLGVMLCAGLIAGGLILALHWPLRPALMFGALVSATDPCAVIALLREAKVKGRIALLVDSESLANDGAAAVLFTLALAVQDHWPSLSTTLGTFALVGGGGIGVGVGVGVAALALAGRTQDHLVETGITSVAAYGAFLAAENVGASGVLATVTAGLMLGNLGVLAEPASPFSLTMQGRTFVLAFWEFAAFLANSFVFLLIGLALAHIKITLSWQILVIISLALLGRAVAVYPVAGLFAFSSQRLEWRDMHFLWWGGLRGALALSLALSLPTHTLYRNEILISVFAVVAFSVLIQGLTAAPLLRLLGFAKNEP